MTGLEREAAGAARREPSILAVGLGVLAGTLLAYGLVGIAIYELVKLL
jgi:hypothetical protein